MIEQVVQVALLMSAHINKFFVLNTKNLLGIIVYNPTHLHIHLSKNLSKNVKNQRRAFSGQRIRYTLFAIR